jgi:hypothetical protein
VVSNHQRRRAIIATVIGNGLEWFDFTVYSFFAVIIAKLFFPTGNDLTSCCWPWPPSASVSSCVRWAASCWASTLTAWAARQRCR